MNFNDSVSQDGRNERAIIPPHMANENRKILMPNRDSENKDVKYRLDMYIEWLDLRMYRWFEADLAAYRDYLLKPHHITIKRGEEIGKKRAVKAKSPATVAAHLATIRGRYNALLISNTVRQSFWDMSPADASPSDRKAFVDEILVRLQNAVHPTTAAVKQTKQQDEADSDHLRLKQSQAEDLIAAPGVDTMTGIRDTAIIALTLCTGIREAELTALNCDDLRQTYDGKLSLRVQHGKGDKKRMIPYGPLDWCLFFVDHWLSVAGITEGAVFRGFYRGGKAVRPDRLTTRSINEIMNGYPIMIDGKKRVVKPHDLRRSYARLCYDQGFDTIQLQQNLGHASLATTQLYIGALDGAARTPPKIINSPYNLKDLVVRWSIA